jgi:polysaccharide biosynthesis transport protein
MNKIVPPIPDGQPAEGLEFESERGVGGYAAKADSPLALANLIAVVRRRAIAMGCAFAAVIVASLILFVVLPPRYTATSTVLIDPHNQTLLALDQLVGAQTGVPISVENQVQILTTSSFAGRVINQLKLDGDPEFRDDLLSRIFDFFGAVKSAVFGSRPKDPSVVRDELRDKVTKNFLAHMSTDVTMGTSVIAIQFSSRDAKKAAEIANAVADSYITDELEAKFDATRIANNWLSQRLGDLRQRVAEAETAAATYAAQNNLQVLNQAGETLQDQRVAQLNADLLKARADLADKQTEYDGVKAVIARGGSVDAIPELMSSAVFQNLRTQRAALIQQQSQMSPTYGARHPEMIKLNEQIASVNQQINAEIQRILSALQSEVSVAKSQVDAIEGSLKSAQEQNATANQASVHLRELQRNAESAKSLYESFLKRFNELGEEGTLPTTDARVISRAIVPAAPSFPKPVLFFAGALLFGILAAAVAAFVLEQFDRGLRTRQQVEGDLNLPMLASLPLAPQEDLEWDGEKHNAADLVYQKPLSAYNEAFRLLRAGVSLSNVDSPPRLILITSALPSEGKSTGALSFARSVALTGDRVLLVDGDIRRPAIAKILGFDATDTPGLVQCITKEAEPDAVIINDKQTPLKILMPGGMVQSPPDVLSSAATRHLFAKLKQSYDLVIVDSSPVLPVIDSRILGAIMDTTVFFVRWEETPKDAASEALRLLHDFNVPVAGVALTMADRKRQRRYGYYGDSYNYYGYYQHYYAN